MCGGSSWQSLARRTGDIETEHLNGEIVRLAHRLDREAPINAALTRLTRAAVSRGLGPGVYSVDELADLLGL